MSYLGRTPKYGHFERQTMTGDGSTVLWPLDYIVPVASSILVSVGGVIQEPEHSYVINYNVSTNQSQIQFTEAPPNNSRIYIVFLANQINVPVSADEVPSQSTFPSATKVGQEVWRTDLDAFFKWNGSEWIQI